jgi:hypothetical protein
MSIDDCTDLGKCRDFTFHLDPASEVVAAKFEPISTDVVKLTFFAMWQPQ